MAELKHTPGPWFKHPYNLRMGSMVSYGDISKGQSICIVMAQKDQANGESNARLIAAAPDLLDALEEASHYFYGEHHPDHPTCKRIRAAIAKATQP